MLRKIGAVIAGLIVAILLVQAAELVVHRMHPPPPGMNPSDFEQIKKFVASLPPAEMLIVLAGWLGGTVAGAFIAARIGRSSGCGYAVTVVLLILGIVNAVIFSQPVWFSVAAFLINGGGIVGARLGATRPDRTAPVIRAGQPE